MFCCRASSILFELRNMMRWRSDISAFCPSTCKAPIQSLSIETVTCFVPGLPVKAFIIWGCNMTAQFQPTLQVFHFQVSSHFANLPRSIMGTYSKIQYAAQHFALQVHSWPNADIPYDDTVCRGPRSTCICSLDNSSGWIASFGIFVNQS